MAGLLLFAHRFYNPRLMRWLTTDPLGFDEGLNLYPYVRNNPFCYKDPDGRMVFLVPLVVGAFGAAGVTISVPTLATVATTLAYSAAAFALGWGTYDACKWGYHHLNQVNDDELDEVKIEGNPAREEGKGRRRGRDNEIKGGPPRDPITGNYLPEPAAEGTPHTTIGTREGKIVGPYTQGATFGYEGEFKGRTDVTGHGRSDHPNPHYHPAKGPNSTKPGPHPIPDMI